MLLIQSIRLHLIILQTPCCLKGSIRCVEYVAIDPGHLLKRVFPGHVTTIGF